MDILDKENEEALIAALSLSGSPVEARKSITTFLSAVASAFHGRGVYPWQLRVLIEAVEGLDHGIVHPILRPSNRPGSRPQDPGTVWEARAALVLALETRAHLGETMKVGAKQVLRDAGYEVPARSLLDWKDRFDRKARSRAPRDGQHWEALDEGRAHLSRCASLEPEARLEALETFYANAIRHARSLMPDQPLR